MLVYDCVECIKKVKKTYPLIPKWIIVRVLYAEDLYMYDKGIITYMPKLKDWTGK